jgi:hypothetical protein
MNNTDNSSGDDQQSADVATDYRALLLVTRPLVITEHTLPSWRGGEIWRSGFGISSEPRDWCPESILSRGEVLRPDESGFGIVDDEEIATVLKEAGTYSSLQIRICIGMS